MSKGSGELKQLLNRTPHWQLEGSAYFVTWRLLEGTPDLTEPERDLVQETIKLFHEERYRLFGYVIMNNHVHVLVQLNENYPLSKAVHSWKSYTANKMQRLHGRSGQVWQKDYWDRIVRSEEELYEKARYIVNNPVKRWPDLTEYKWVEWFEF